MSQIRLPITDCEVRAGAHRDVNLLAQRRRALNTRLLNRVCHRQIRLAWRRTRMQVNGGDGRGPNGRGGGAIRSQRDPSGVDQFASPGVWNDNVRRAAPRDKSLTSPYRSDTRSPTQDAKSSFLQASLRVVTYG